MFAGLWADRLSVNIELPAEKSLCRLAPDKSGPVILGPMENFSQLDSQLDAHIDPKTAWALRHIDFCPIEVNRAE